MKTYRATQMYAGLLRLYPARFRAEHAAEMKGVFAELITEAAGRGQLPFWRTCWHELRDLPLAVGREHWREYLGREGAMSSLWELSLAPAPDDGRPGSSREALLAGLPHGLAALYLLIGPLFLDNIPLTIGLTVLAVGGLLAGLAAAWRAGWPRWSASWALYWCVAAVAGLSWAGQGLRAWNGQALVEAAFFFIVALALPAALAALARRDRIAGLLLALPVVLMLWLPVMEFVPNAIRNLLQPALWVSAALIAFGLVRGGSVRRGVALTLGLNLAAGLIMAYSRAYLRVYPGDAPAEVRAALPTLDDFFYWLIPALAAFTAVLSGPVLARALWQLGQAAGRRGQWASRLTIAGLLLAVAGNFAGLWAELYGQRPWSASALGLPAAGAAYGGLGLAALGLGLFLATPLRHNPRDRVLLGVLAVVALGLPFAAALPLWMGFRIQPPTIPFGFLQVYAHSTAVYGAATVWWLAAGALALYVSGRRRPADPPPGALNQAGAPTA